MTAEFIQESLRTGRVPLSRKERNNYFFIVKALLSVAVCFVLACLWDYFLGKTGQFYQEQVFWLFIVLPLGGAGWFYWLQKGNLRYTVVGTELSEMQLRKIIYQIGRTNKWRFKYRGKGGLVAEEHRNFRSARIRIYLVFDQGQVFINSICNPEYNSIYSQGRNAEVIEILTDAIREEQKKEFL